MKKMKVPANLYVQIHSNATVVPGSGAKLTIACPFTSFLLEPWKPMRHSTTTSAANHVLYSTVDLLIMHSFFEHLFPLHGWPRTLHQKIVTYSCRVPSLIVESQKWMYSLEWHTLGMLHKNMHYEIVNCTLKGETRARCAGIDETPVE